MNCCDERDETDDEVAARFERDVTPSSTLSLSGAMRMPLQSAETDALVQETMVRDATCKRPPRQARELSDPSRLGPGAPAP